MIVDPMDSLCAKPVDHVDCLGHLKLAYHVIDLYPSPYSLPGHSLLVHISAVCRWLALLLSSHTNAEAVASIKVGW